MTRFMSRMLLCAFLLLLGRAALCTGFDEHLWEKYAEIETSSVRNRGSLAGVYLEPRRMGDVSAKAPFADLRVITDRKEEVPWQIVSERPEKRTEEIPAQMRNLSQNDKGETWLELLIDRPDAHVNAVE